MILNVFLLLLEQNVKVQKTFLFLCSEIFITSQQFEYLYVYKSQSNDEFIQKKSLVATICLFFVIKILYYMDAI